MRGLSARQARRCEILQFRNTGTALTVVSPHPTFTTLACMSFPARAAYLDLLETVLTVGMILAQVVQIADEGPAQVAHALSVYVNVVTFPNGKPAIGLPPRLLNSGGDEIGID
jgi:hypothetical protein